VKTNKKSIMKNNAHKLTLYKPETYQIIIPGALDTARVDDTNPLNITVEENNDGKPISILTGLMDQAALQGLLRRLYALGLPLSSVNCVRTCKKNNI
jgi:hypothetical protein